MLEAGLMPAPMPIIMSCRGFKGVRLFPVYAEFPLGDGKKGVNTVQVLCPLTPGFVVREE